MPVHSFITAFRLSKGNWIGLDIAVLQGYRGGVRLSQNITDIRTAAVILFAAGAAEVIPAIGRQLGAQIDDVFRSPMILINKCLTLTFR